MVNQESTTRTLLIALAVCLVSSVFVAGAAVAPKPTQAENHLLDKQRSTLAIAGLGEPGMPDKEVKALSDGHITAKIAGLQGGTFGDTQGPLGHDSLRTAKNPTLSETLPAIEGIVSIKRRGCYTTVYLMKIDGRFDTLILPVCSYGLWSTLYGFLAPKDDLSAVAGFGFCQYGETPGLDSEASNLEWEALWVGRTLYDVRSDFAVQIIKGLTGPQSAKATHQIDGLAGAILTNEDVGDLLHFWLDEDCFDAFLASLCKEET